MMLYCVQGNLGGTAMAVGRSRGGVGGGVGSTQHTLAVGSSSGVVNVYDCEALALTAPKLRKSVMNLTTAIDNLTFSPDGQMCV